MFHKTHKFVVQAAQTHITELAQETDKKTTSAFNQNLSLFMCLYLFIIYCVANPRQFKIDKEREKKRKGQWQANQRNKDRQRKLSAKIANSLA